MLACRHLLGDAISAPSPICLCNQFSKSVRKILMLITISMEIFTWKEVIYSLNSNAETTKAELLKHKDFTVFT